MIELGKSDVKNTLSLGEGKGFEMLKDWKHSEEL